MANHGLAQIVMMISAFVACYPYIILMLMEINVYYRSASTAAAGKADSKPKISIIVIADPVSLKRYEHNLATLACYSNRQGYTFIARDASDACRKSIDNIFFLKHCTVLEEMKEAEQHQREQVLLFNGKAVADSWFLVLDADNAVVNFNHRIEDYISKARFDNKDIIHGLRFHNNEVIAGNYLVRNTQWAKDYLEEWASLHPEGEHEFGGMNADNGALHWLLLHRLANETTGGWSACKHAGKQQYSYQDFVECFHHVVTATGCRGGDWPHVAILPRGEHVTYDTWITNNKWSNHTFMLHALKPGVPYVPVIPKINCTTEAVSSFWDEWYVDPDTYEAYRQEAFSRESKLHNVNSWDSNSCLENGQLYSEYNS